MLLYHLNISEFIFEIRWISYGSHNLTCYYHCFCSPKMTQLFPEFCLRICGGFMTTYHHSNATSKNLLEWQWSVHSIPLPLHCHSILTTPLPLRSGNAVLICIFATHSNATPVSHSNATPKVHFNATPECTLHCHSITTTPTPISLNTPMPLRSVFGVLICIFATHSYATPIPLHKVGVASQCTLRSMEIVHSIVTPKTLYCHSVRVRGRTYHVPRE